MVGMARDPAALFQVCARGCVRVSGRARNGIVEEMLREDDRGVDKGGRDESSSRYISQSRWHGGQCRWHIWQGGEEGIYITRWMERRAARDHTVGGTASK
jgi:hypothetical protein